MTKTILITGATDGIGLEAAKRLAAECHHLLLHGRNAAKLDHAVQAIRSQEGGGTWKVPRRPVQPRRRRCPRERSEPQPQRLDVLINNAGVFRSTYPSPTTGTRRPLRRQHHRPLPSDPTTASALPGRRTRLNLSSAAQAPVDPQALAGEPGYRPRAAYAQSKLALTMWTRHLATRSARTVRSVVAVNPGSLLATKMVKEGYGIAGNDINIGVDILVPAALAPEFAQATGRYFDNDSGRFAPHPDALDPAKTEAITRLVHALVSAV